MYDPPMKIPFNMIAPTLKLQEGETALGEAEMLRKKGIFGNRHGELWVTSHRVAFVKAVPRAGMMIGGIAGALIDSAARSGQRSGKQVEPMAAWPRAQVTATKAPHKKVTLLTISDGTLTEKFMVGPEQLAAFEALVPTQAAAAPPA